MKKLDVAIIGAGATGMAAAIRLYESGITNIMLFDRNAFLGGILKQCIHNGFGISYFGKELTGPEYSKILIGRVEELNIPYHLDTTVLDIKSEDEKVLTASSTEGLISYKVKAVIFALGCRERTRENIEIPGTRPAGIFTAGLAQALININGYRIGHRVVIQGSGDIGLIMARRLAIEGYDVIEVLEKLPYLNGLIRNKVQCLDHFNIPLSLSSEISEIRGFDRVEGVFVNSANNNQRRYIECDTTLFAVGLIPELELPRKIGVKLENNFNPVVSSNFESDIKGMFFCGNCLHINDLADNASREGELAAEAVCEYLVRNESSDRSITSNRPYKEITKNQRYNYSFFDELRESNTVVCIVCPKSCLLTENANVCKRGMEYLKRYKDSPEQYFITSVFDKSIGGNISVKSKHLLPVQIFTQLKQTLRNTNFDLSTSESIEISLNDEKLALEVIR